MNAESTAWAGKSGQCWSLPEWVRCGTPEKAPRTFLNEINDLRAVVRGKVKCRKSRTLLFKNKYLRGVCSPPSLAGLNGRPASDGLSLSHHPDVEGSIKMSDWRENKKGNHVYVIDTDQVMTVFRRADGSWAGVYQDEFTKGSFDSAQEAMRTMEPILDGDTSMLQRRGSGWVRNKDGEGHHIRREGRIASVRRSRSGSWYASVDGRLLEGRWFKTDQEAKREAERVLAFPTSYAEYPPM